MKCPYCDERIDASSKFCPKCGLPLKDDGDTTVMGGAYLTDDTGPSIWVILGGAAAIIVVALSIGWMSSNRQTKQPDTVRRTPLPSPAAPGAQFPGAQLPSPTLGSPSFPGFAGGRSSHPSASYGARANWAYKPPPATSLPARTAQPGQPAQPAKPAKVEPAPPPAHALAPNLAPRPRRMPRIVVARSTVPAIPSFPFAPPAPAFSTFGGGTPGSGSSAVEATENGRVPLTSPDIARQGPPPVAITPEEEARSGFFFDPVQERWIRRTPEMGAPRRTNIRTARPAAPAPASTAAPARVRRGM
jgi:zinc ribbon protein